MTTESIREVRDHLADVVERNEPTIITRRGKEIAAVVPIEILRKFRALEDADDAATVAAALAADDGRRYSLAEVMAETMDRPA
jgi:prevent-host-death family protein